MTLSRSIALGVCATALMLISCSSATSHAESKSAQAKPEVDRKAAPDFELKDSDGRTVKLSDYKGKVVLLNFWATWCGPCKIEIPWFIEFQRTYKDKGLVVLGVATDEEGWEVIKPYVEAKKMNYPVLLSTAMVEQAYGGIDALPTTFLVDRDGRVADVHVGLVSKKTYEDEILELLK